MNTLKWPLMMGAMLDCRQLTRVVVIQYIHQRRSACVRLWESVIGFVPDVPGLATEKVGGGEKLTPWTTRANSSASSSDFRSTISAFVKIASGDPQAQHPLDFRYEITP